MISLNKEPASNLIEDVSTQLPYFLVQIKSDYSEGCLIREAIGPSCLTEDIFDILQCKSSESLPGLAWEQQHDAEYTWNKASRLK